MIRSARFKSASRYIRKGLSSEGIKKILTRPEIVTNAIRTILTDTKLKSSQAIDQVKVFEKTFATLGRLSGVGQAINISAFGDSQHAEELARLFNRYGSDKARHHNYYLIYAKILEKKRFDEINILEIGLGTNNLDVPSNMGTEGKPGASLRAFRDFAPSAKVFGADIDTRILFTENRIKTFFIDQTDPPAMRLAAQGLPTFDLIIDDGLHNSEANLNTLEFALPLVKDGGSVVIEDVSPKDLDIWRCTLAMLQPRGIQGMILRARLGLIIVFTKQAQASA